MAWYDKSPYKSHSVGDDVEGGPPGSGPERGRGVSYYPQAGDVIVDRLEVKNDGWLVYWAGAAGRASRVGELNAFLCAWHANGELIGHNLRRLSARYPNYEGNYRWFSQRYTSAGSLAGSSKLENLKVRRGEKVHVGWVASPDRPDAIFVDSKRNANGSHFSRNISDFAVTPGMLNSLEHVPAQGDLWLRIEVVENQRPNKPALGNNTAQGEVSTTTPTVEVSFDHPPGDREFDYTDLLRIEVYDTETQQRVFANNFGISAAERNTGFASFQIRDGYLERGKSYRYHVAQYDSFGYDSEYSDFGEITVVEGPPAPDAISPKGKIDTLTEFQYGFDYVNPNGVDGEAYQIHLYERSGAEARTLLANSNWVNQSMQPGTRVYVDPFHGPLHWDTHYEAYIKTRDVNGAESSWDVIAFRTNAFPYPPTGLSPSDDDRVTEARFSCSLRDPDGDPVTEAEIEIVRADTGEALAGYPKIMQVSGATATHVPAPDVLEVGVEYRWRARAKDAIGYGERSEFKQFLYAIGPSVQMLSPAPIRTNLIPEPSAERVLDPVRPGETPEDDETLSLWEQTDPDDDNEVRAGESSTPASGENVWTFTSRRSTGANVMRLRGLLAVYGDLPHVFSVTVNPLTSGGSTPEVLLELVCFDAAEAEIGRLRPDSFSASGPVGAGRVLGGHVFGASEGLGAPSFPPGTAFVRPELSVLAPASLEPEDDTPSMTADGFLLEPAVSAARVEAGESVPEAEALALSEQWSGYFDGSSLGYGEGRYYESEETGYYWRGDPEASASEGLSVLSSRQAEVTFSYASAGQTQNAKASDRLILRRYTGSGGEPWQKVYDSGDVQSGRTSVPIPEEVLTNESRYSAEVFVTDSGGLTGQTERVEFDVFLPGPPSILILDAQGQPSRGVISVSYEAPALGREVAEEDFAGVEVGREAEGEPFEIVNLLNDPSSGLYEYHFPANGKPYALYFRILARDGALTLASRWSRAEASVTYPSGVFFLKDVRDPEENSVAFKVLQSSGNARTRTRDSEEIALRGRDDPAVVFRKSGGRSASEISAYLAVSGEIPETPKERFETFEDIERERPPLCLLSGVATGGGAKAFVALVGEVEFSDAILSARPEARRTVGFQYVKVGYAEDYYKRHGYRTAIASPGSGGSSGGGG